ncbi:sigma-70 family RNA polymerase sigma factor [Bacillus sp. JJ722]|uniref:sigma-70 family RNA polymerase sigma factor n=1 Tax=Bacillus sp. JJ722 TaxID=3122973 RepID=UPI0030006822
MEELLLQYRASLREVRKLMLTANEEDKKILGSMASDLVYAIEWMRTGKQPGPRRGIERRAAYQKERPCDPILMQRYFRTTAEDVYEWDNHQQEDTLSYWDRVKLDDALSVLTEREKEIFLMSKGNCLSFSKIADLLEVSKSTVQDTIERADKKITEQINTSLFCFT